MRKDITTYRSDKVSPFTIYTLFLFNCQVCGIAPAEALLQIYNKQDIKEIIDDILIITKKPQILMDVSEFYAKKLKSLYPEEFFVLDAPYINTTGNKMRIIILKPPRIKNRKFEK